MDFARIHAKTKKTGVKQLSPTVIRKLQKKTVRNIVDFAQGKILPHCHHRKYMLVYNYFVINIGDG